MDSIYVVESDTHKALIVAESASAAGIIAMDARLVNAHERAASVARLGTYDPGIQGVALGTGILVVERRAQDFWPLRGASEGLHLPDRDGVNVGRNGRTLGPVDPQPVWDGPVDPSDHTNEWNAYLRALEDWRRRQYRASAGAV